MNQSGFASIVVIIALPLVALLLLGCFWTLWFLNQKKRMDNLCLEYAMSAQEILVKNNNTIIAMNPEVRLLHHQKKALNVLILTGPPPVKLAAQAAKKWVVFSQKALAKTQSAILAQANLRARAALYNLRRTFKVRVTEFHQFWKRPLRRQPRISIVPKSSQLSVQWRDIAAFYERKAKHHNRQAIHIQWRVPGEALMPAWLARRISNKKYWQGQCSTHPHKGGHQWLASIGKGNHSSKQ